MSAATSHRLRLLGTPQRKALNEFAQEVARGLSRQPKQLSPRFFYDQRGSEIFEQICDLPEYYLTRTEAALLRQYADEVIDACQDIPVLVELGSGSAEKTRLLLDRIRNKARGAQNRQLTYLAVDISRSALEESARMLLRRYPELEMTGIAAEYREGLRLLGKREVGPKLILFLGSNIGNLETDEAIEFLKHVRESLSSRDRLLVSTDLAKNREELIAAYDDAAGVTAAFNQNLLVRMNRELGACFPLEHFSHRAIFNEEKSRIEMHLVSHREQAVPIAALEMTVRFSQGESIHTECSHKYTQEQIQRLASASHFKLGKQWFDGARRFALNLFVPI